ncbi:hypothetical protein ISCGN_026391 [Ixodes scapularis]
MFCFCRCQAAVLYLRSPDDPLPRHAYMSAAIVSTRASIALSCESSDPWRFQYASTIPTAVAECDSRSSRAGDGVEDAFNGDVVGAAFCGTPPFAVPTLLSKNNGPQSSSPKLVLGLRMHSSHEIILKLHNVHFSFNAYNANKEVHLPTALSCSFCCVVGLPRSS